MQICRITVTNSEEVMQERIEEFRQDPDKMRVATKFIDDLVVQAEEEVTRRKSKGPMQAEPKIADQQPTTRKSGRWHLRARSYFLRAFASICLCNSTGGRDS